MKICYFGKEKFQVFVLGFGCMGMSFVYGGVEMLQVINMIYVVMDMGVIFLDIVEVYGFFDNEVLVGKVIKGFCDKVQIVIKFGFCILLIGQGLEWMVGVDSCLVYICELVEGLLK